MACTHTYRLDTETEGSFCIHAPSNGCYVRTYLVAELLVATYALLLSKLVRHCHLWDLRDLESPRALSSALATARDATVQGPRGF